MSQKYNAKQNFTFHKISKHNLNNIKQTILTEDHSTE